LIEQTRLLSKRAAFVLLVILYAPCLTLVSHQTAVSTTAVALITGATGLIGREIAVGLAASGMDIIVPCRPAHQAACTATMSSIWARQGIRQAFVVELVDLANASSIYQFIDRVKVQYGSRLRVLVNNAAVINRFELITTDGMEMMFQVNVWAYYALMDSLLPVLERNLPSSIVNVASAAAYYARDHDSFRIDDMQFERRTYDPWTAYAQSKAADLLLTWKASRLQSSVMVNALHPGILGFCPQRHFKSSTAGAFDLFPMQVQAKLMSACNVAPSLAADRAVWLATQAPALNLTGSWWVMNEQLGTSVRMPLLYTDLSVQNELWKICRCANHAGEPCE